MKTELFKHISNCIVYTTEHGSEYMDVVYKGVGFKICCQTQDTVEFSSGRMINGVKLYHIKAIGEFFNEGFYDIVYNAFRDNNIEEKLFNGNDLLKLSMKTKIDNF